MKRGLKTVLGVLTILLGGLIVLTPHYLAPVCKDLMELKSGLMAHMACYYTGQTAIVIGALIIAIGIIFFFAKEPSTYKILALVIILDVITLNVFPLDAVIGICKNSMMMCHKTVFFLRIWSALLLIVAVVDLAWSSKKDSSGESIVTGR
jgi:hypothetical protein